MAKIVGTVEDIIYKNEENGYAIIGVSTDSGVLTCVGTLYDIGIGEEISMEGDFSQHPIYGKQFNVQHFEANIPQEKEAFERYLGSGAIKGIGPVLAKKIVETFGDETFRIIEEEPERLEEVKGISMNKAQSIGESFYSQRTMRQAIIFLQQYQISLTYAVKIYETYRERTYEILQQNPYKLAEDIQGIGFKVADDIAKKTGISSENPHRLMAAIIYVLNQATMDGHIYLNKEDLLKRTRDLLMMEVDFIDNFLTELQWKNTVIVKTVNDEDVVYLTRYYQMEEYCAMKICECLNYKVELLDQVEKRLKSIQEEENLNLDECQTEAVEYSTKFPFMVLTGGPGTGKTTTINTMIRLFEQEEKIIFLAAPTGRAAKRMTETTGHEAKTIHRLLEINFSSDESRQSFERNEEYPLECDVLIIDEASMLDIHLFFSVLKAVPLGCRVIFVGDKDQLPSVGPGNVLHDLIAMKDYIPVITLQKIYRQEEKSAIVQNAHKINQGKSIDYKNKSDFFFIRRKRSENILEEIKSLISGRLSKFTGIDYREGIQILSPMRKGLLGIERLNIELQNALNPSEKGKEEKTYRGKCFREGDKVMQIRNNYSLNWKMMSRFGIEFDEGMGVFNGDLGVIREINPYSETVKVEFDDLRVVTYEFPQLEELELAYAITIHKSQGSEYPIVIIPLFKGPAMLLSRNLLYTAVTRAKQMVVLVGDEEVLNRMIGNNREIARNSTLNLRIKEGVELFQMEVLEKK